MNSLALGHRRRKNMKRFKVNRPLYVLETRKENNDAVEAKVVESPIKMVEEVKTEETNCYRMR
jgi:hypothetical protein